MPCRRAPVYNGEAGAGEGAGALPGEELAGTGAGVEPLATEPQADRLARQLLMARTNLRGYLMLMLRYAKSRGESAADLARFLGEQAAPTWGRLRNCAAIDFARALAQLVEAGGDEVVTVRDEGGIARLELRPPSSDDQLLAAFGIERDEWHALYYGQFERIATWLGLRCLHEREGDLHRFYFARIARFTGRHQRPLPV